MCPDWSILLDNIKLIKVNGNTEVGWDYRDWSLADVKRNKNSLVSPDKLWKRDTYKRQSCF